MDLSVIITTYNQPEWLRKVLLGYVMSEHRDFEIVIADDGSDERTRHCIEEMSPRLAGDIQHVWHEDSGFGKCGILNRAILSARAEYLVFTDGDCIPRRDFLTAHARNARRGHMLSGGYIKLPMSTSHAITDREIASGEATNYDWLRAHGMPRTRQTLRLAVPSQLAAVGDALTPTKRSFNGHNASCWRADMLRVNGFDNRMGWGGLDREVGERLRNAGVRSRQVRFRALVVHLDHKRDYRKPEIVENNCRIRTETRQQRRTRTAAGIAELAGVI